MTIIVFVNDLHVGHPFAVCPVSWVLHDGNVFTPNDLQIQIRAHWVDCWQHVRQVRKGARLIIVPVGDLVEGNHHETTQLITQRIDTQEEMAVAVLEEGMKLAGFRRGDIIRFVTGTPAHDGNGLQSIERIARSILDTDQDGRVSYDRLRFMVRGQLFDVAHQPGSGPGGRAWLYGNSFQAWLKSLYYESLETGQPVPNYVIRAHYHTYLKRVVHNMTGDVVTTGYILPAWKLKDEHVYKRQAHALGSIGMLIMRIDKAGCVTDDLQRIPIEQDRIEEL